MWHELNQCATDALHKRAVFYATLYRANSRLRRAVELGGGCTCVLLATGELGTGGGGGGGLHARRQCECAAPLAWLDLSSEGLQSQPAAHLRALSRYLGVAEVESYVRAASSVVRPSRHATSHLLRWPPRTVALISEALSEAGAVSPALGPLLEGYARHPPPAAKSGPPSSLIRPTRTGARMRDCTTFT